MQMTHFQAFVQPVHCFKKYCTKPVNRFHCSGRLKVSGGLGGEGGGGQSLTETSSADGRLIEMQVYDRLRNHVLPQW